MSARGPTSEELKAPRSVLVAVLAAAGVAVLAHFPALFGGFVLDDWALLVENPHVRSLAGLGTLLRSELFAASGEPQNVAYYRPISAAAYWLSYQLLGAHAGLQHALNLLLHGAVAALLVMLLFELLGLRRRVALAVTTLLAFGAHPASPEIVAYIGGRQDMLGWIAVLLTWQVAVRREWSIWALAGLAFTGAGVAALCREFFFAAPVLLLPAALASKTRRLHAGGAVLAGGALAVFAVLALRRALHIQSFELATLEPWSAIELAAGIALRLLSLLFLPSDVAVQITPPRPGLGASLVILLVLALGTALALALSRRRAELAAVVAFAAACFWASVAMHVPVVLKYGAFSDRYAYGALIAAALGAGAVMSQLPSLPAAKARLASLLGAAFLLALVPLTWARDAEWRDEPSLQRAMLERRPSDPESRFAEGMRLLAADQLDEAHPHCLAYAQAKPDSDRAGLCLGTILLARGEPQAAAAALEPYAYARPGSHRARVTLFRAWFAANDLEGVARGLAYFGAYIARADDLEAAERELARRRALLGRGHRP